eukprot:IDg3355t1
MYEKKQAEAGKAPRSAPPLSSEHIIAHGKHFLLADSVDTSRYHYLKCSKYGVELGIADRIKNGTN